MKRPVITLLVGRPGVGKSTWIKNNRLESFALSSDAILDSIAMRQGKTYDQVFVAEIERATKIFKWLLARQLKAGRDVIIDRTNLDVRSRASMLAQVPKHYIRVALVFSAPVDSVLDTRLSLRRGKSIPASVLTQMKERYTRPTIEEGFDAILDAEEFNVDRSGTSEQTRRQAAE